MILSPNSFAFWSRTLVALMLIYENSKISVNCLHNITTDRRNETCLDEHTTTQASIDQRLCHPARCVRRRPVNLGEIFAGESTTTVRSPTTVRIDDYLPPSQPRVTLNIQQSAHEAEQKSKTKLITHTR